jgi:hypothetical protein
MSRLNQIAAVGLALCAAFDAGRAQTSISIAAGATAPTGSFGNVHDVGYHVLGALGIAPPLSPLAFRLEGSFSEFNRTGLGTDAKDRVLALTGNGVLKLSGSIGPYAIGGVGLYDVRRPGFSGDSNVGFNIGGGYRFGLTGFSAFAEARYHRAGDGQTAFIPITFGIAF